MSWLASRHWIGIALLVGVLAAGGCGSGMQSSVTGSVTLDGKPVNHGTVAFLPLKDGATAYGTIAPDGSYSLNTGAIPGASPGDYIATVIVTGDIPPPIPGKAPEPPKPLSPMKYSSRDTSDLKVTVKAGSNVIPLEMVTPK